MVWHRLLGLLSICLSVLTVAVIVAFGAVGLYEHLLVGAGLVLLAVVLTAVLWLAGILATVALAGAAVYLWWRQASEQIPTRSIGRTQ